MKKILHKLAHFFSLNYGNPYSFYAGADLLTGFECSTCGVLEDIKISQRS